MKRVVFSRRAQRQVHAARHWWSQHRDKAPEAFEEELGELIKLLRHSPLVAHTIRAKQPGVRRILVERIRYYFYYRVNADEIEVIFVWHASRRPPRL